MRYYFLLLISSSLLAQSTGWNKDLTISVNSITRYYDAYVPQDVIQNPALIIQLHGGTQNKDELHDANAGASKYWKEVADKEKFILLVPNGTNLKTGATTGDKLNWNDCRDDGATTKDVQFISDLIDKCIVDYKINDKKVFVTGVSNGGFMSYRLALELPNKITAIAAFAANFPKDNECVNKNVPIPVMIVNGSKDKFIPFNGGITKFKKERIYSSLETLNFWIAINKLENDQGVTTSLNNLNKKDKSTIQKIVFGNHTSKNTITYCVVNGGGHSMPGKKYVLSKIEQAIVGSQNQDIEGATLAWDFFSKLSK